MIRKRQHGNDKPGFPVEIPAAEFATTRGLPVQLILYKRDRFTASRLARGNNLK
jgi:hypothetical protein